MKRCSIYFFFFKVIKEIEAIFYRSGLTANIEIKESNIMIELYGGEDLDVIFNIIIFIAKWEIWKIRNKVKYNQIRIGDQTISNTWKNNYFFFIFTMHITHFSY